MSPSSESNGSTLLGSSHSSNFFDINDETERLINNAADRSEDFSEITGHDGLPSLPKGAMHPPRPNFQPFSHRVITQSDFTIGTPPATPSQRLLGESRAPKDQFAGYTMGEKVPSWPISDKDDEKADKRWVPLPLRTRFWIPFVLSLIGGAIALEVALHFSNKYQGWAVSGDRAASFAHYAYTFPPVVVAMVVAAMWTWTDIEIKKMQPYVDLVHGDSPPHRSLLLDYTRTNNFVVWTLAAANRHYLVALTTLMVLVSLALQPLAASLLTVKDTWIAEPDVISNSLAAIGLNQNPQFQDLTSFLTAAGYASASVLYKLGDPPFIHNRYTVGPFQLPSNIAANGTVFANTSAVRSDPGCQSVSNTMVVDPDGLGWTVNATLGGCSASFHVDKSTTNFFGTNVLNCPAYASTPRQFLPVIFWFFTYQPAPSASATFCFPTIELFDVNVNVDLASGNLTQVTELGPFTAASNFSSLSSNVTGTPLNGQAYNGIEFNLTNPDIFVLERLNATHLSLPAAVFQAAESSSEGLAAVFNTNQFVQLSTQVYSTYLQLIAKTVYFLPFNKPLTVQVKTVRKRLWLSDTAVHLLVTAMLVLAVCGTFIHIFHYAERQDLYLAHEPGTIASAVSIGAQTNVGNLLAGRQRTEDIVSVLHDKKFRIDVRTMKVVMEGEEGYEDAASPAVRRGSIFAALQGQRRSSKRLPKQPSTPSAVDSPEA